MLFYFSIDQSTVGFQSLTAPLQAQISLVNKLHYPKQIVSNSIDSEMLQTDTHTIVHTAILWNALLFRR
jgi:hypothetical protein